MADYRREYRLGSADLATLSLREFLWLLQGLSKHSRFQQAWHDAPKRMNDPADRAALVAAARR